LKIVPLSTKSSTAKIIGISEKQQKSKPNEKSSGKNLHIRTSDFVQNIASQQKL
jgi:hypothetical protein